MGSNRGSGGDGSAFNFAALGLGDIDIFSDGPDWPFPTEWTESLAFFSLTALSVARPLTGFRW